jgi:hypothetical protein
MSDLSAADLDFASASVNSNNFLSENPSCVSKIRASNQVGYECSYTSSGNIVSQTVLNVSQTKFIDDIVINKRRTTASGVKKIQFICKTCFKMHTKTDK